VVLLGVLVPPFVLPGLFPLPTSFPQETQDAFNVVDSLPADRPVLVAFDFEPAQAGELGPVADALVGHMVRRGLPIVAVSTSATGAGVGQEMLERLTTQNAYSETVTHINLGYLPGGPVGILQFASDPRTALSADFAGRDFADRGGLWALPLLRPVRSLEDFSAAVLISATPEDARAWIEQTQGLRTRLVLAVSAGVAPLVRPYYEADQAADPAQIRLAGFVSGATGAMQYETRAGVPVPLPALIRWEMLGGGLLTIALWLILGNLAHGALRAVRGAQGQTKGKAG
jgi:hypothetical protein